MSIDPHAVPVMTLSPTPAEPGVQHPIWPYAPYRSDGSWGEANPSRGAHHDKAAAFVVVFPLGTRLNADQFDRWAIEVGYLPEPSDRQTGTEGWLAHLQRRHQLKYNLIRAGTHPRMRDAGLTPFTILSFGPGNWRVAAPETAMATGEIGARVNSLVVRKRAQLAYLLQSANWAALPPVERMVAEAIFDDIETFAETINVQATGINRKLAKLERRLSAAGMSFASSVPDEQLLLSSGDGDPVADESS